MAELTLEIARKILDVALAKGVEKKLKPLVVTVLDARGCVKISAAQDGTSLLRSEIAHGKAYGALAMGMGSRALFQRAQEIIPGGVNSPVRAFRAVGGHCGRSRSGRSGPRSAPTRHRRSGLAAYR